MGGLCKNFKRRTACMSNFGGFYSWSYFGAMKKSFVEWRNTHAHEFICDILKSMRHTRSLTSNNETLKLINVRYIFLMNFILFAWCTKKCGIYQIWGGKLWCLGEIGFRLVWWMLTRFVRSYLSMCGRRTSIKLEVKVDGHTQSCWSVHVTCTRSLSVTSSCSGWNFSVIIRKFIQHQQNLICD